MMRDVFATLKALEEQLLDPAVRQSRERVAALISEDFIEIGASGKIYDKTQVVDGLAQERVAPQVKRSAYDFQCRMLSDAVALLTYKALHIEASVETRTLRSSIWKFEHGRWQLVFHQGTPSAANK